MIRTLLSFVLVLAFFWFFPDIYLWTRNVSNALFQEAAQQSALRVEVKVTKPMMFLPVKFGVLAKGEKDYYVEFFSEDKNWAKGARTDSGTALLPAIDPGVYQVNVGLAREYSEIDIRRNSEYGEPLLLPEEFLSTTLPLLDVKKDVFAVAVITEQ